LALETNLNLSGNQIKTWIGESFTLLLHSLTAHHAADNASVVVKHADHRDNLNMATHPQWLKMDERTPMIGRAMFPKGVRSVLSGAWQGTGTDP
jgi:hypothetical protein